MCHLANVTSPCPVSVATTADAEVFFLGSLFGLVGRNFIISKFPGYGRVVSFPGAAVVICVFIGSWLIFLF